MGTLHPPFGSPIDLGPSFSKNQKLFANLFDMAHGATNKGISHAFISCSDDFKNLCGSQSFYSPRNANALVRLKIYDRL